MRLKRLLLPLLALTVSVSVASAGVLDVRGPTPDYDEIADAVNAAADGDVIRVWPGDYDAFWIDDKSLTLVSADDSGAVIVDGTHRIKNLAPHRSVEISGIGGVGIDGHALVVSNCQGSVRIREGHYVGASSDSTYPWDGVAAVFITGCDDVELSYCTARAGLPAVGELAGFGGDGMRVEASDVSLYVSTFEGSSGTTEDDPGASGHAGGHGILSWGGGRHYLSGCTLIGGHGGHADYDIDWWTGEYGYGGSGGWGYYCSGLTVDAWFLDNDFQPGYGGVSPDSSHDGSDGQDTTAGTHLPGDARLLRASRLIEDTASIGLIFTGTPGDLVCLRAAGSPGYTFDVERGPFLLATRPAPELRPWKILGTIDGSGVFQATIAVADLPSFGHRTRHLQGNLIGAENYFTASSWTVILDDAW